MKRVLEYQLTVAEEEALARCADAAEGLARAQAEVDAALRAAVKLGLPLRMVAERSRRSPSHVSKLVNGKYVGSLRGER